MTEKEIVKFLRWLGDCYGMDNKEEAERVAKKYINEKNMLKATDFRINNLVQDDLGNLLKVKKLDGEDITLKVVDRSKFPLEVGWKPYPIPLTEEWLFKFGFKLVESHDDHLYYLEETDFSLNRSFQFNNYYKRIELKYVHQLQNLYFALTGEELTIK